MERKHKNAYFHVIKLTTKFFLHAKPIKSKEDKTPKPQRTICVSHIPPWHRFPCHQFFSLISAKRMRLHQIIFEKKQKAILFSSHYRLILGESSSNFESFEFIFCAS